VENADPRSLKNPEERGKRSIGGGIPKKETNRVVDRFRRKKQGRVTRLDKMNLNNKKNQAGGGLKKY